MSNKSVESNISVERFAGILAHPTSFPSPYGIGDLGGGAYHFIDFLQKSNQKLWQVLPLGHTGFGDSPYQSFSAFAGQPLLISPDKLRDIHLLSNEDLSNVPAWDPIHIDYGPAIQYKTGLLKKAYENFKNSNDEDLKKEYTSFCRKNRWLNDYALFMAGKDYHGGASWLEWNDELSDPDEKTKKAWLKKLDNEVGYYKFIQFIFFKQWFDLKQYANDRGVQIIGDIPIFVSVDSADVWSNKSLFKLDSKGYPTVVAGVPPDYFSATGQLWGNPLYDWEEHKKTGYAWWIERIKSNLTMTDYLRIDHFRGFETYWEIPYGEPTAINGKWVKGPCDDLFNAIQNKLGKLPIIAEDLGDITDGVRELRDQFEFPGMKILQFAFDNVEENDFLPHYYNQNCVCYTGTHDNDTSKGWYDSASEESKDKLRRYLNTDANNVSWDLIRACFGSTAKIAIVPLQDVFSLGAEARMNTPGVAAGNWAWRYTEDYLSDGLAQRLRETTILFGR